MAFNKKDIDQQIKSGQTERVDSQAVKAINEKLKQHDIYIKAFVVVISLAFISLVFSYFTMLRDVYKEYSSSVSQFNNEKLKIIEQRIDNLEKRRR